jgi:hypothetical protein
MKAHHQQLQKHMMLTYLQPGQGILLEFILRRSFYATLHFGERGMERRTPLLRLRYHGNCGQRAAKCHCHSLPLRSVQGAACSMHVEVM